MHQLVGWHTHPRPHERRQPLDAHQLVVTVATKRLSAALRLDRELVPEADRVAGPTADCTLCTCRPT